MFRKASFYLLAASSILLSCREERPAAKRFTGSQIDAKAENPPAENPSENAEAESKVVESPAAETNTAAPTAPDIIPAATEEADSKDEADAPTGPLLPSITAISVKNSKGEAPKKGDSLKITFSLKNEGSGSGSITLSTALTGLRFTDFEKVPLSDVTFKLEPNTTEDVTLDVPLFLEDSAKQSRFALGRGNYELFTQMRYGSEMKALARPTKFEISEGPGVFALVMYDKRYFEVGDAKGADPEAWVKETFTRKASVYFPGTDSKKIFPGGFDEMMGITHSIKVIPGLDSEDAKGLDVFDRPEALASKYLNLSQKWSHGSGPGTNKHGFDYFIALDKDAFGGVTFGAAQVSGAGINGDFSRGRMQMLIGHESGHVFGSPHCDPVQGFIMCSGEKNAAYKVDGEYVWHEDSFKKMKNIFK